MRVPQYRLCILVEAAIDCHGVKRLVGINAELLWQFLQNSRLHRKNSLR